MGVSVSGAMDTDALALGNRLVGNDPGAAAVEVTFGGASFEFDSETLVAITGADLGATLDGLGVPGWTALRVAAGGRVSFANPVLGLRAYLCVAGGIATDLQLGSRSTHIAAKLGGLNGRSLREGDVLPIGQANAVAVDPGTSIPVAMRPDYSARLLQVRLIPQADAFTAKGLETFHESEYLVTDRSDRQGIRFDGPVIETTSGRYDIVSDAVTTGSVQVPGDGKPIVLMADRQTTGGYAKIGVVATVDLPLLAQVLPGTPVRFAEISVEEGQELLRARQAQLLEEPLALPFDSGEQVFGVEGAKHAVRIGGFSTSQGPWFAVAELDGTDMLIHVEEIDEDDGV